MANYGTEDLRKQFSLDKEEFFDYRISPIFDIVFHTFRKKVEEDPDSFGITDIVKNSSDRKRDVVMNSKVVSFGCNQGCDVDHDDMDSSWYMATVVGFSGTDDAEVENLRQKFADFVAAFSFEELRKMAAEAMMEERSHLNTEMWKFYYS